MPIIKVLSENKNSIKRIVNEKPSYGSLKILFITTKVDIIKIISSERIPNFVINPAGPDVDDKIASNPYFIKNFQKT